MPVSSGSVSPHRVAVVIPVYQGEKTLDATVTEILALPQEWVSSDGHVLSISEVLLVWDNGPDGSAAEIRRLAAEHDRVRAIWLSRNFGQHAATLAGMASSGGDWVVTLDEDGQHDPRSIPDMLDVAMRDGVGVVYAKPINPPPHGALRNVASRLAKRVVATLGGGATTEDFQSYRLVLGEIARSVAAYAGPGIYLDVALAWVCARHGVCPVTVRAEGDRPSGYRLRTLLSHFWRMIISSGTRGLRVVSVLGALLAVVGVGFAAALLIAYLAGSEPEVKGWVSLMLVALVTSGAILFSLGVVAEYVGVAVNMAMGKPLYLIVSDPELGPLGRRRDR